MAVHTQSNVQILICDVLSDLPAPATVPTEGTLAKIRATGECRILLISAAGVHTWVSFCCVTTGCSGGNP